MKRLALPALLAFSMLASCNDNDIPDYTKCPEQVGPPPAGYKVLFSIDTLRNSQRQLEYVLKVRDTETYPCKNYTLQTSLITRDNQLIFTVCDAQPNGTCVSGQGNAVTYLSVNGLVGSNQPFEINIRGQRTTGTIRLVAPPYSVSINDTTYAAPRQ